jgi:hypothetical protein
MVREIKAVELPEPQMNTESTDLKKYKLAADERGKRGSEKTKTELQFK